MKNQRILISGAGVAGPALAFWLDRFGFRPTIVERAPAPRTGGQAVDFRGRTHLRILREMGILADIERHAVRGGEVSFVDAHGRTLATMSSEVASGDVEILRGDLGRILFDATRTSTEYMFDDSIRSLEERPSGVAVTFMRAEPREFDLVVGADGLHSVVRTLAFGPDSRYVHHLGYYVAIASVANVFGDAPCGRLYCAPGRAAGVFTGKDFTRAVFYCAASPMSYDRHDVAAQKRIVARLFDGMRWETPRLIREMNGASDFYLDAISEVRLPTVSNGRVTLVGDAAYGGTLGGMGTGAAIVEAYVLAGELAAAAGDHSTAYARYEERTRAYALRCQRGARGVGRFMAPRSRMGIWLRNRMLNTMNMLPGKGLMERIAMSRAEGINVPEYSALHA